MTPHEALLIADILRQSYADVCIYGAENPITVVAKQNVRDIKPRPHIHRACIARNVRGVIRAGKDGGTYLLGPNEKHKVVRRYHSVTSCTDCGVVLHFDPDN